MYIICMSTPFLVHSYALPHSTFSPPLLLLWSISFFYFLPTSPLLPPHLSSTLSPPLFYSLPSPLPSTLSPPLQYSLPTSPLLPPTSPLLSPYLSSTLSPPFLYPLSTTLLFSLYLSSSLSTPLPSVFLISYDTLCISFTIHTYMHTHIYNTVHSPQHEVHLCCK